jgi:hypothetical protein
MDPVKSPSRQVEGKRPKHQSAVIDCQRIISNSEAIVSGKLHRRCIVSIFGERENG